LQAQTEGKCLKAIIMQMITDPERIHATDPGHPDICNVFSFYKIYCGEIIAEVEARCKKGLIGCTACKDQIWPVIYNSLKDFQEKRERLIKNIDEIYGILEKSSQKVRKAAGMTIAAVREKMGID